MSDYEVGRGRTPLHTRFKKGDRANPRGRPKGSPNLSTIIKRAAREKVAVTINGRRKMITKLEAAMTQLANQAAAGDRRAIQLLIAQIERVERASEHVPAVDTEAQKQNDAAMLAALKDRLIKKKDEDDGGDD